MTHLIIMSRLLAFGFGLVFVLFLRFDDNIDFRWNWIKCANKLNTFLLWHLYIKINNQFDVNLFVSSVWNVFLLILAYFAIGKLKWQDTESGWFIDLQRTIKIILKLKISLKIVYDWREYWIVWENVWCFNHSNIHHLFGMW